MNTVISLLLMYMFNSVHRDTSYWIAKGLLDHIDELSHLSVNDFASLMGTSTATLNRFCKEIGFQNFRELKAGLEGTRDGRLWQIKTRMDNTSTDRLLDTVEFLLNQKVDRDLYLERSKEIARKLHDSREAYITGAVYPLALSLDFVEDLFLFGCKVRILHSTTGAINEKIQSDDFCLILTNTGRFLTLNKPHFLSLYTRQWDMAILTANDQFSRYDKISTQLILPAHPENFLDNQVFITLLQLIEYQFYQEYVGSSQ